MTYNEDEALRAVLLSDFAYADSDIAEEESRKIGASRATFFVVGEVEFIAASFGEDVWIAFRGTEPGEVLDYIADARIVLRESPEFPGRVHSGFASNVETVFPYVMNAIDSLRGPSGLTYLAGHSKGGAEAILTAARLRSAGDLRVGAVYSFGAPAVGDCGFASEFDRVLGSRTFRHVFASDWVARSPFLLRMAGRYCDAGRLVYLTRSGVRTFNPNPLRKLIDATRAISRRRGFRDHGLDNYVRGLT